MAALPGLIQGVSPLSALQVEGIALAVILFLGVQSAAALLVEPDVADPGATLAD